jgi:hypothetical protein
MNQIPEVIYLQIRDEDGNILDIVNDEVTWCAKQINENDVMYVRARTISEIMEGVEVQK